MIAEFPSGASAIEVANLSLEVSGVGSDSVDVCTNVSLTNS